MEAAPEAVSPPLSVSHNETISRAQAVLRLITGLLTSLRLALPGSAFPIRAQRFANFSARIQNIRVFVPGQSVRVNLAGLQVKDVLFQAAVTGAVGTIVKQTCQDPPKYLVKLLFSFRGISEVEVPSDRISPN